MGRSAFFKHPQADVEAHIGRRGVQFESEQYNGLNGADLPGATGSRVLHRDGGGQMVAQMPTAPALLQPGIGATDLYQ